MLFLFFFSGQTDKNVLKISQGWSDDPLNNNGLHQASKVAEELSDVKFSEIFTSPLQRAKNTAKAIYEKNKFKAETPFIEDKELIERDLGVLEGKKIEFFVSKENRKNRDFTPEDGESKNQVYQRVYKVLNSLCKKYIGKNIPTSDSTKDLAKLNKGIYYEEFLEEYSNQWRHVYDYPKVLLVTHSVVIKELINVLLVSRRKEFLEWIEVENAGITSVKVYCEKCIGKCFCDGDMSFGFTFGTINNISHFNGK